MKDKDKIEELAERFKEESLAGYINLDEWFKTYVEPGMAKEVKKRIEKKSQKLLQDIVQDAGTNNEYCIYDDRDKGKQIFEYRANFFDKNMKTEDLKKIKHLELLELLRPFRCLDFLESFCVFQNVYLKKSIRNLAKYLGEDKNETHRRIIAALKKMREYDATSNSKKSC